MVDIDNVFLNGNLKHEINVKIPEGYGEVINPRVDREDCLIWQKAMYGLVEAARQFLEENCGQDAGGSFQAE